MARQQQLPGVLRDARYGSLPGPRPVRGTTVTVSFRASLDLEAWIIAQARSYGISESCFMASVMHRYENECREKQSKPVPVVAELKAALRETELAIADGVVTPDERVRIQRPLAAAQNGLWNEGVA